MWNESFEFREKQDNSEQKQDNIMNSFWLKSDKFSKKELDNIKELDLKNLNKGEKYSKEDINTAIEARFDTEIKKLWSWVNSNELNLKKSELANNLKNIDNIEDKLKAYSEAIDWLKWDVWTWIAEQKKQDLDLNKKTEEQKQKDTENKYSFYKIWKEIRELINELKIKAQEKLAQERKENWNKEQQERWAEKEKSSGQFKEKIWDTFPGEPKQS